MTKIIEDWKYAELQEKAAVFAIYSAPIPQPDLVAQIRRQAIEECASLLNNSEMAKISPYYANEVIGAMLALMEKTE